MAVIEKVINGLKHCTTSLGCFECPYSELDERTIECQLELDRDALELLKNSVPQSVVDQIRWERDTALSQLKEIGKGLGEKMDAVKPKWIPVTERKPKSMANKVIVYVEHEDLNPQIGYGHYEKFQGVEMWYNLETQEQFSKHGYTVTHWMPMPKSLDGKRLILD